MNRFIFLLILFSACREKWDLVLFRLDEGTINSDQTEHFFERVADLDMRIQMSGCCEGISHDSLLAEYKSFLKNDVVPFTQEDKYLLSDIDFVLSELAKKENIVFPKGVQLLKIRGNHYGKTAFYTRENTILVPEWQLINANKQALLEVIIHELFHILSRQNSEKRKALYESIGFRKLDKKMELNDFLKERILLNPDGMELDWSIVLTDSTGYQGRYIPIIYSTKNKYEKEKGVDFFDYLKFSLYEVKETPTAWMVVPKDTLGKEPKGFKDFFYQIGNNTEYIIHPDEILADNYTLLVSSKLYGDKLLEKLSPAGREFLKKNEDIFLH